MIDWLRMVWKLHHKSGSEVTLARQPERSSEISRGLTASISAVKSAKKQSRRWQLTLPQAQPEAEPLYTRPPGRSEG